MIRKDIKNFLLNELEKEIYPPYRARQIFLWVYKKGVNSFKDMKNIPEQLIDEVDRKYYISNLGLGSRLKSIDKTEKFLFKLEDGNFTETVLIYAKNRKTICLSTQAGCRFGCCFCASGARGFIRNLQPAEIINQILFLRYNLGHKITNYVLMGMGEPLDNYDNVSKAILIMNEPKGMDIGARGITISTCGIIPGIKKLGELGLQINLSISLHAGNDKLRSELMPVNKRYPLEDLIKACEGYFARADRMITLEYILIKGKNDSLKDADELAVIAKRLKAKVNLIPYSPSVYFNFQPIPKENVPRFIDRLTKRKVNAILRESKGQDIQAACGQLALHLHAGANKG